MTRYSIDDDEVDERTREVLASLPLSDAVRTNVENIAARVSFGVNPAEYRRALATPSAEGVHDWRRFVVARIVAGRRILASVTHSAGARAQFLSLGLATSYAEKAACVMILAAMQEGLGVPMGFMRGASGVIEAPEAVYIHSTDYAKQGAPTLCLSSMQDVYYHEVPLSEL